jgi:hypothetical protein
MKSLFLELALLKNITNQKALFYKQEYYIQNNLVYFRKLFQHL